MFRFNVLSRKKIVLMYIGLLQTALSLWNTGTFFVYICSLKHLSVKFLSVYFLLYISQGLYLCFRTMLYPKD